MHNADAAFPTLVSKLLPAGVKGIVVCGILAALMSSLASLFDSSAMLFTIDFYKRFRPETSEKKLVVIGQIANCRYCIARVFYGYLSCAVSEMYCMLICKMFNRYSHRV